jgi:hypothetical protein
MFRAANDKPYSGTCGKCGATRFDQQLGLEATPDLFVANMVDVFREVRRVLRRDGTCWVNLGDSYSQGGGAAGSDKQASNVGSLDTARRASDFGMKPKDLVGIPWRVAFALQADGWYLRSDIVWSKPNPMPESVTDRPTKAHEYVFLLTRSPRYFFDQEAVRETATDSNHTRFAAKMRHGTTKSGDTVPGSINEASPYRGQENHRGLHGIGTTFGSDNPAGRNVRSVWNIEATA